MPIAGAELICVKCVKTIQQGKDSPFNKKYWDSEISTYKRMKLDPCAVWVNSKWIEDLNLRARTVKRLQETMGDQTFTTLDFAVVP